MAELKQDNSIRDRPGEASVPLEAVEARRLYRQVADQLRALIDSGEYVVGSRLPTERDIAEQLKVSRPTVREALIALEVEGRVRIRVGSGIYVSEPAALAPLLAALKNACQPLVAAPGIEASASSLQILSAPLRPSACP